MSAVHSSTKSARIQIGDRFGRLVVIGPPVRRYRDCGKKFDLIYPVVCDCGNTRDSDGSALVRGRNIRCLGCKAAERPLALRIGETFVRWTVIGETGADYYCHVRCECGVERNVYAADLRSGKSKSCGCWNVEQIKSRFTTHGMTVDYQHDRIYRTWTNMMRRCYKPNTTHYDCYGGKGIKVCPQWHDPETFRVWAEASGYRDDLTIERKDINRDYEPSNCTWIPLEDQALNRTNTIRVTAFGETKVLSEWTRDPRCVVTRDTIIRRIGWGYSPEEAMTRKKKVPDRSSVLAE